MAVSQRGKILSRVEIGAEERGARERFREWKCGGVVFVEVRGRLVGHPGQQLILHMQLDSSNCLIDTYRRSIHGVMRVFLVSGVVGTEVGLTSGFQGPSGEAFVPGCLRRQCMK